MYVCVYARSALCSIVSSCFDDFVNKPHSMVAFVVLVALVVAIVVAISDTISHVTLI